MATNHGFFGQYTIQDLSGIDNEILRNEYKRLYKTAKSRLSSFKKSNLTNTNIYRYHSSQIKPLSSLTSPRELKLALRTLSLFIDNPFSTVSGYEKEKARRLGILREHGYGEYVNEDNYEDFVDFMDLYHQQHLDELYDSERVFILLQMYEKGTHTKSEIFNAFEEFIKNAR